ncbi:MAG: T9SS type A sorting domain-containing protein, partial [Ignavibacteria bacterium]
GRVIDEGFFYRLPDTIPIARSKPRTTGGFAPGYIALTSGHAGYMQFSRDLTRCFVAAKSRSILAYPKRFLAMRFDELVTGIPEGGPTNPEQPALYPNPTTGSVTIRWDWPDEKVHWQVVSPTGQLVDFGSTAATENAMRIVLASDLAAGRYMLLVRNAQADHVQHFTLVKN